MGAELSYYSSEHLNVTKELVGLQQWWFRNSCGFWIGSLRSMELLSLRQHIVTLFITYLGILFIMVMNTMCLIQQPQCSSNKYFWDISHFALSYSMMAFSTNSFRLIYNCILLYINIGSTILKFFQT